MQRIILSQLKHFTGPSTFNSFSPSQQQWLLRAPSALSSCAWLFLPWFCFPCIDWWLPLLMRASGVRNILLLRLPLWVTLREQLLNLKWSTWSEQRNELVSTSSKTTGGLAKTWSKVLNDEPMMHSWLKDTRTAVVTSQAVQDWFMSRWHTYKTQVLFITQDELTRDTLCIWIM